MSNINCGTWNKPTEIYRDDCGKPDDDRYNFDADKLYMLAGEVFDKVAPTGYFIVGNIEFGFDVYRDADYEAEDEDWLQELDQAFDEAVTANSDSLCSDEPVAA